MNSKSLTAINSVNLWGKIIGVSAMLLLTACVSNKYGSSVKHDNYTVENVPVGLLQLLVGKSREDVMSLIGKPTEEYEKFGYLIWEYKASSTRVIIIQFPRLNPGIVASVTEGFDRDTLLRTISQSIY